MVPYHVKVILLVRNVVILVMRDSKSAEHENEFASRILNGPEHPLNVYVSNLRRLSLIPYQEKEHIEERYAVV